MLTVLAFAFVPNGGRASQGINEPSPTSSGTEPSPPMASTQDDNDDAVLDDLPTNLSGHVELARKPRMSTPVLV